MSTSPHPPHPPRASTSPPHDDAHKPKRSQTCFRCRQSKVKCVFEHNPSCRRCLRLGVSCELQANRQSLSWQMRVQHQLATLEGSLQSVLHKQPRTTSTAAFESNATTSTAGLHPTPTDSASVVHIPAKHDGGVNKRTRTIAGACLVQSPVGTDAEPMRGVHTEDDTDLASTPLAAVQKLRLSVLDRTNQPPRSGECMLPNLYRLVTSDVGSKHPRPNVIKQNLISPSDAVVLFHFFAEYLDQYSFGFPTYTPDANMSPMILSSIVCIASLHHAQLNRLHIPLKNHLIARLQTDHPSLASAHLDSHQHSEPELDPQLGIGVEEIVAASLFATWFGGKRAWIASRLARWWSAKLLRQQQHHPAMMTMAEIMSLLPPPRHLAKQDLLRVWLTAYITELHQSIMQTTPSITNLSTPHAVCNALQSCHPTAPRDQTLIFHSHIASILSKTYHIGANGKRGALVHRVDEPSFGIGGSGLDTVRMRFDTVLDAFERLDSCQEQMGMRLEADMGGGGEAERLVWLDLFLTKVLVATIGWEVLDSTLCDGCVGHIHLHSNHIKTSSSTSGGGGGGGGGGSEIEAEIERLRRKTLRESLTRGVEAAIRSLELVCLATASGSGRSRESVRREVELNVLVLPLWFHWALSRTGLFLMNVLAEYPQRLLPRDRSKCIDLVNLFLDLYSKHIAHANMVLSHPHHPHTHRPNPTTTDSTSTSSSSWQQTLQHPATPLLDTLTQCHTWATQSGII